MVRPGIEGLIPGRVVPKASLGADAIQAGLQQSGSLLLNSCHTPVMKESIRNEVSGLINIYCKNL